MKWNTNKLVLSQSIKSFFRKLEWFNSYNPVNQIDDHVPAMHIFYWHAAETILPGILYRDYCFHFALKSNVMVYELITWFSIQRENSFGKWLKTLTVYSIFVVERQFPSSSPKHRTLLTTWSYYIGFTAFHNLFLTSGICWNSIAALYILH